MAIFNKLNIEYSDYYVVFLDVLGFKDLVLSKKKGDKDKIEKYFGLINSITNILKKIESKKDIGSIIISDSVILSVPIGLNINDRISNLRQLSIAVGLIQYNLALENIWLRGAISKGAAYFNPRENAMVGPGYVDAYLLEKQAIYPRVILDNKLIKLIEKSSAQDLIDEINEKDNGGITKVSNWNGNILFDWGETSEIDTKLTRDTALFIDYLCVALNNPKMIEKVVKYVEMNIYTNNILYGKFRWVVDYLLANCERLINTHGKHYLSKYIDMLRRY